MDLDDSAAGAGEVGLDGLIYGTVGMAEHDGGVALVEPVGKILLKIHLFVIKMIKTNLHMKIHEMN